jgi:hypothetical protein
MLLYYKSLFFYLSGRVYEKGRWIHALSECLLHSEESLYHELNVGKLEVFTFEACHTGNW